MPNSQSALKLKDVILFFIMFSLCLYISYGIERHQTTPLLLTYFLLFGFTLWVLSNVHHEEVNFWFFSSILLRAVLLFSIPNLSDDFYRFIWDGRLLVAGYHPFAEVPSHYIVHGTSIPGITQELYEKLNSKEYFTIYPPIAQFVFWLSVKTFSASIYGSMVFMKFIMLSAEIGNLFLIRLLLRQLGLSEKNVLIYSLNPLVILELTGNLHFEALMIFFLLLSIYLLHQKKLWLSAVTFSFSVCVKLIPLIFLPLLIFYLGWKRALIYYLITLICIVILFLPLYDQATLTGLSQSIGYYFIKFEFNASIYYLVRELGYWYFGYNIIQIAGWVLGLISAIFIFLISFNRWISNINQINGNPSLKTIELLTTMMWCLLAFFLLTTTLHPWYISILLVLSLFTQFKFVIVWTALIFLTYSGYSFNGFSENLWIIAFEYSIMLSYLVYELTWKKRNIITANY